MIANIMIPKTYWQSCIVSRQDFLKLVLEIKPSCKFGSPTEQNLIVACNRELRGVWPGAAAGYDRRTNRASMHLRIAESDRSEESIKSSALNSHTSLKRIAEGAGKFRLFVVLILQKDLLGFCECY